MAVLYVHVQDQYGQDLEGVLVKLTDLNHTVLSQGTTDPSGIAFFDPPAGTYYIRMYKPGIYFDGQLGPQNASPQRVVLPDGTYTAEVLGRLPDLPESTDPRLCLLSGHVVNALFQTGLPDEAHSGTRFRLMFTIESGERIFDQDLMAFLSAYAAPDEDGYIQVALPRGTDYVVSTTERQWHIHVPDRPAARLEDVLWPYPVSVSPDTLTLRYNIDPPLEVSPVLTWSDGYERPFNSSEFALGYDASIISAYPHSDDPSKIVVEWVHTGQSPLTLQYAGDVRHMPTYPTIMVNVIIV